MKIAEGYLVKEVAEQFVLFPIGQNIVDYKSILTVNKTGKFVVEHLQEEISYEELLLKMVEEYEASKEEEEILKKDLNLFLDQLRTYNILCE